MTTANLQVPLDRVSIHREMSGERANRPSLGAQDHEVFMILLGQLGIQAASLIDRLGNRLNVVWVHAQTNTTEMVGLQPLRPRTYTLFPNRTMSDRLFPTGANLSVAAFANGSSLPNPAGSNVSTVLNREVALVYQTFPQRHTGASYLTIRARLDGYE